PSAEGPTAICLVGGHGGEPLSAEFVNVLMRLFNGKLRWLAEGRAAEIVTETMTPRTARDLVARDLEALGMDVLVLPAGGRRKSLLVADMDSTLITIECIDELADTIGLRAEVASITERAMAGGLDFASALVERVALLEGVPETAVEEVIRERLKLTPGAEALIATMRANGAMTALVSGGFTLFSAHVAQRLGLDVHRANRLEIRNGRLTGRLLGEIVDPRTKLASLLEFTAMRGLERGATMAVGDGANDREMIEAAGLGVAFHARLAVQAVADISVNHGDLETLLFIQGYDETEIVRGR
ncbi:MAG: phosphoserine phosphatase SerB, partial [Geminicoccaceae bacterium]|nr:phosphoserine phosphatase SerB [Geminicoccaceae bacterium]